MSTTPPATDDLPILYVTPGSDACRDASTFLDDHGIGYRKIDVSERPSARADMEKLSGQPNVPVLDWHGRVLTVFDREELVSFLRSRNVKLEDS
jgi:glutaredoxin